MSQDLLSQLTQSPDAYLQKIDFVRDAGLLIQFDARSYRAASFLDDRILTPATIGAWAPLSRIVERTASAQQLQPLHFIFHAGHVGSTLLSRLLDETGFVLSLREPLPLRALADAQELLGRVESLLSQAHYDSLLRAVLRVWSRGYDSTRAVIVKATSSAGRAAGSILQAETRSRALYLNVSAEVYLATLLGGRNSAVDLRGHGAVRIRQLESRVGGRVAPLHALSPGELAAMSWLVETLNQRDACSLPGGRVLAVDFDEFLVDVHGGLRRALEHFELPRDPELLSSLSMSPVLKRYSKAAEFEYSPEIRLQVLNDSRRKHEHEIGRGLAWLENLGASSSTVASALNLPGA